MPSIPRGTRIARRCGRLEAASLGPHFFLANAAPVKHGRYMQIEVSITRTTKPYVGRIVGLSERYGFDLEFCRGIKRHSSKHHTITVTEAGVYRTNDDVTIGSRGVTSGFFRVSEAGEVTEISKDEAAQAAQLI